MTPEEEDSVKHLYTKEQALLQEEVDFDIDKIQEEAGECFNKFTEEQNNIFTKVIGAIDGGKPLQVFISA